MPANLTIRSRPSLPRHVLAHLFEEWPEGVNLAPPFAETVARLEVLVAARTPQSPGSVNDQGMANAAAEDSRAVCPGVDHTSPGASFRVSRYEALDFADQLLEAASPVTRFCPERLRDRAS